MAYGGSAATVVLTRARNNICTSVSNERVHKVVEYMKEVQELDIMGMFEVGNSDGKNGLDKAEFYNVLAVQFSAFLDCHITEEQAGISGSFCDTSRDGYVSLKELEVAALLWMVYDRNNENWRSILQNKGYVLTGGTNLDREGTNGNGAAGPSREGTAGSKEASPKGRTSMTGRSSLNMIRRSASTTGTGRSGTKIVQDALKMINHGAFVSNGEAEWVVEMAESFCHSKENLGVSILLSIAFWYISKQAEAKSGILRERLIERLDLELHFRRSCVRLVNIVLMFAFITASLGVGGVAERCRGIRDNLYTLYELDSLGDYTTIEDIHSYFVLFSKQTSVMSPLSPDYFEGGSEFLVLSEKEEFLETKQTADIDLWIGEGFTMQAWVQLGERSYVPPGGLPILRKQLGDNAAEVLLSCWSWVFPATLYFGAQDYGQILPSECHGLHEECVTAKTNYSENAANLYIERQKPILHTLLVNKTHATFMIDDGRMVGTPQRLPRPVTDCINSKLNIGAKGLTLSVVRFYPRILSMREIFEVHHAGNTMKDIGFTTPPSLTPSLTELAELDLRVKGNARSIEVLQTRSTMSTQSEAQLTAEAIRRPGTGQVALNTDNETVDYLIDESLGIPVWLIHGEPVYTDKTSANSAPGYAIPQMNGQGMTVAGWLKFVWSGAGSGYFVGRASPRIDAEGVPQWDGFSNFCWTTYVGGGWTYFSFKLGGDYGWGPDIYIEDHKVPKHWQSQGKRYRHFLFRMNPGNIEDPLSICIEGVCVGAGDANVVASTWGAGKPKEILDCQQNYDFQAYDAATQELVRNESKIFLNRRPPNLWHLTANQMNVKYYNRWLNDAEVNKLFQNDPDPTDPARRPMQETKGCRKSLSDVQDNRLYTDDFGRDCTWYYEASKSGGSVCQRSVAAQENCPIACNVAELCWGSTIGGGKAVRLWDQQNEFRHKTAGAKHQWGTTCVGKSTTPEKEALVCWQNAPNRNSSWPDCSVFENDREQLLECIGDIIWEPTQDPLPNYYMPCKDIILLHEPTCDFDDEPLDDLAADINRTDEWAIQFWVESMTSDCNQPQIRLIDGDGKVFSALLGYNQGFEPGVEGCNDDPYWTHAILGRREDGYPTIPTADLWALGYRPNPGERHLFTFGQKKGKKVSIAHNTRDDVDTLITQDFPIPPSYPTDRNFLRVINVIGRIRMSPWTVKSYFPSIGELSSATYDQQSQELLKKGPTLPLQEQMTKKYDRSRNRFNQKSFLVVPAVLVQARAKPGPCASDFADSVVQTYVDLTLSQQCSAPYDCGEVTPSDVYECPDDEETDDSLFFGINAAPRMGDGPVYVEYLSTIADNVVLVRDNKAGVAEPLSTEDFLDSRTKYVRVMALFYSVEFGITTELRVTFDTRGGRVRGTPTIRHYQALTGSTLETFNMMMLATAIFVLMLLIDNVFSIRKIILEMRLTGTYPRDRLFFYSSIIDFIVILLSMLYLGLMVPHKLNSAGYTERVVGEAIDIPWSSTQSYAEKRDIFLNLMDDVTGEITFAERLEHVGMAIAGLLLLRMVVATSAHPRIALVCGTLAYGASDLFHLCLIFFLVLWGFASIASWKFGREREDLGDILNAMCTFFDTMLDPPGLLPTGIGEEGGSLELVFTIYAFVFHIIFFFLMINFVLAIIVNSYMKVLDGLETMQVEQNIISDVYAIIMAFCHGCVYRWPGIDRIIHHVSKMDQRFLNTDDFIGAGFHSQDSAKAYFKFYGKYSFLTDDGEAEDPPATLQDVADQVSISLQKQTQIKSIVERFEADFEAEGKGPGGRLTQFSEQPEWLKSIRQDIQELKEQREQPEWAGELMAELRLMRSNAKAASTVNV